MLRVFKWLFRGLLGVIALTVLVAWGAYYFATRSLPDYNETAQVVGLQAPLEIVRDNANVPHFFGQSDEDVFFGLGYAHATDRLWQMMLLRRTVQGRLSEVFGTETLPTDMLLRRLDLYNLAVASVRVQSEETQKALAAYSAGVNARIARINEGSFGRGAPEFFLFSPKLSPWQPADSLAILKLMALDLSRHLSTEVLTARASLLLSRQRLEELLPPAQGPGVAALPEFASLFPGMPRYAADTSLNLPSFVPGGPRELAGASNAWAASAKRAASDNTLLANDPHLGFTAPSIWYLARLELQTGGVIGGTIPGVPMVLLGRSNDLGWGLTSSYADDQDAFLEELNPDNPSEYRTPDGFKAFETRQSIIEVKDAPAVTITLRWTDNGPVLPSSHENIGTLLKDGFVASLSWTALSAQDTSLSAGLNLMKAGNISDAIRAMDRGYIAPLQNLMLADREDIALVLIGALPRRTAEHQTQGRMPSPGWIASNRWQGRLPASTNPRFVRPEGGILGNTNNKMVDKPFPNHVSFHYGDTERIQRWSRLMQARGVHTRESFIEAQLDTVSNTARTLLPLIGADLWFADEAAPEGTRARQRKRALDLLANWNGEMNEHLPEPLLYQAWMRALSKRLIQDELGPLHTEFTHTDPVFVERVFRDIDGASIWCDVIQSAPVETCTDIASLALDDALQSITDRYGGAFEALRWGDAHQAMHDHPVLGKVPVLGLLVNIRQSTSGGDNTLNRGKTAGEGPLPYANVHGAGYRGVYDFADPDSSVFVTSTGQSGHPFSRYYDNLGALWRRGEYIPMSLDPELARAAAVGVTELSPAE
ncbi:MAG: penicillin acylase family protein [Pseudomonadota bacterium]